MHEGIVIILKTYIRGGKRPKISDISFYLKAPKKKFNKTDKILAAYSVKEMYNLPISRVKAMTYRAWKNNRNFDFNKIKFIPW